MPQQKQLKEDELILVGHGGKLKAAGAWSSWSHVIHYEEAEVDE